MRVFFLNDKVINYKIYAEKPAFFKCRTDFLQSFNHQEDII